MFTAIIFTEISSPGARVQTNLNNSTERWILDEIPDTFQPNQTYFSKEWFCKTNTVHHQQQQQRENNNNNIQAITDLIWPNLISGNNIINSNSNNKNKNYKTTTTTSMGHATIMYIQPGFF